MPKYEIMVLLDPKLDLKIIEDLSKEIFGKDLESVKKYDQTQLAYPINNSTTGLYGLIYVNTNSDLIAKFTEKLNYNKKSIWRYLIINLDSEQKLKTKKHFIRKDERRKSNERSFKQDNRASSKSTTKQSIERE